MRVSVHVCLPCLIYMLVVGSYFCVVDASPPASCVQEAPTMELWETMTALYQKMETPPAGSDMEVWKKTLVANVGTLLDSAWSTASSTNGATETVATAAGDDGVVTPETPAISAPTTTPTKAEDSETVVPEVRAVVVFTFLQSSLYTIILKGRLVCTHYFSPACRTSSLSCSQLFPLVALPTLHLHIAN